MAEAKRLAAEVARAEHEITGEIAELRKAAPVALAGAAAEIADQPPLFALSAGTLALGLLLRRAELVRAGVRMLAAEAVATAIKSAVKHSVDRARPAHALTEGPEVGSGRGGEDTAYNSFPSGHTAGAVAVAQAVAHELPGAALPARLAAAAVGAVQLPHGKHYLTDVAAGAVVGWGAERIVGAVMAAGERAWTDWRAANDEAEAEAHPS